VCHVRPLCSVDCSNYTFFHTCFYDAICVLSLGTLTKNMDLRTSMILVCVWFGNQAGCNVMFPFRKNGLVPFLCLV
jgi:hypothetical protein